MGLNSWLEWPEGNWQKGATTTLLLEPWIMINLPHVFSGGVNCFASKLYAIAAIDAPCMHACMQCKEWMESFLTNDFVEEKSLVDERVAFIALATRLASIISCREHAITARIN